MSLLATLWRLGYLSRLAGTPLYGARAADAQAYWDWATSILMGHALAGPHFLGPIYPHFLAGVRAVAGPEPGGILILQSVLGGIAVGLLTDAARRLTSVMPAAVVGVLLSGYGPAVFFDGLLLSESLLFSLEALLLWLVVQAAAAPARWILWALAGLVIGTLTQARATSLVLLVPLALVIPGTGPAWNRIRFWVLAVVCAAAVSIPTVVENFRTTGEFVPFTYSAGFNLYVGNGPAATGAFVEITGGLAPQQADTPAHGGAALDGREYLRQSTGRTFSPTESSAHWTRLAIQAVVDAPLRAVGLVGRKALFLLNARGIAQIENLEAYELVLGPVGFPVLGTFSVLGTLGLIGGAYAWGRGSALRFPLGYVLAMGLSILPFFVTDRYRHHLLPGLGLLAALAIQVGWGVLRSLRRVWPFAALALATVVVVHLPMVRYSRAHLVGGTLADVGLRYLERGDTARGLDHLGRAVGMLRGLPPATTLSGRVERAQVLADFGEALLAVGRYSEASDALHASLRLNPADSRTAQRLAAALDALGQSARAESLLADRGDASADPGSSHLRRGWAAARGGRLDEARRYFREAVEISPRLTAAWEGLIRIDIQLAAYSEADRLVDRAEQAGLPLAKSNVYRAAIALATGDLHRAALLTSKVADAEVAEDRVALDILTQVRRRLQERGLAPPQER